jgi:hypothetical protein
MPEPIARPGRRRDSHKPQDAIGHAAALPKPSKWAGAPTATRMPDQSGRGGSLENDHEENAAAIEGGFASY